MRELKQLPTIDKKITLIVNKERKSFSYVSSLLRTGENYAIDNNAHEQHT